MNKSELNNVIKEVILEMLKEGDESLINLMMEHEKNFGEETDRETFLTETIQTLSEELGVLSEEEEAEEGETLTEAESEKRKMLSLVEFLDTGQSPVIKEEDGKLEGWSTVMFGSVEIGEEFKLANDPDNAILIKISPTQYQLSDTGQVSPPATKYGMKPNDKVYTKKG